MRRRPVSCAGSRSALQRPDVNAGCHQLASMHCNTILSRRVLLEYQASVLPHQFRRQAASYGGEAMPRSISDAARYGHLTGYATTARALKAAPQLPVPSQNSVHEASAEDNP